jgi:hypothetical protein
VPAHAGDQQHHAAGNRRNPQHRQKADLVEFLKSL